MQLELICSKHAISMATAFDSLLLAVLLLCGKLVIRIVLSRAKCQEAGMAGGVVLRSDRTLIVTLSP
jgi:hypothetical protein